MIEALFVLSLIVVVLAVVGIAVYNRLTMHRERTRTAFSQIDVQLERRYDLIPNLVKIAQRYLTHEQDTLTDVIAARASATQARIEVNGDPSNIDAMRNLAGADGNLGSALGRLLAVSEQYPELKADTSMATLTEEIRNTENRVSFARQAYNDETRLYETYRQSFPQTIVASATGFDPFAYLETTSDEARDRVEVTFN